MAASDSQGGQATGRDPVSEARSHSEIQGLLRDEIDALRLLLEARFTEIAALTRRLESAGTSSGRDAALQAEIEQLKRRHALEKQLLTVLYTSWHNGPAAGVPAVSTQLEVLSEAELFDTGWYLSTYPDIADAGMGPKEHYVRSGAFEGRNPGPQFDTMAYYLANPDIAAAGWPALVHYVMFGKAEGRALG